jgi:hypothetical protein
MTHRKHLKSRVRARMAATGERYAAARAHVVGSAAPDGAAAARPVAAWPPADAAVGTNAATAALRVLLDDAGTTVSEPLALVLGGGIGMGVFRFHYAKEAVSTFFLAGRHHWDDDLAFLRGAFERLGLEPRVAETTSSRVADRHLRDALAGGRPVVAWVDLAELGTRAYPAEWSGGGYHVVVVRAIDEARGIAMVDDLAPVAVEVPLDVLARARGRIAKARHRLLWLAPDAAPPSGPQVDAAVRVGLRATVEGLDAPRTRSFSLDALQDWATRLRGTGKDSWAVVFPPGGRLWSGLAAIHEHIEHFGSGGGLVRPAFAAGLREASERLGDEALAILADRYAALGAEWSKLAAAALPGGVPSLRRTRELQDRRAARYAADGPAAGDDLRAAWEELGAIRREVDDGFPVGADDVLSLLDDLAARVTTIHGLEVRALAAMRERLT